LLKFYFYLNCMVRGSTNKNSLIVLLQFSNIKQATIVSKSKLVGDFNESTAQQIHCWWVNVQFANWDFACSQCMLNTFGISQSFAVPLLFD